VNLPRRNTSEGSPGSGRRIGGLWRAIVVTAKDPLKLGRVKVRIPELLGDLEFAWANVLLPVGGKGTGGFGVPKQDAEVYVQFVSEDPQRPIVVGATHSQPAEDSTAPLAAKGDPDPVRDTRGTDTALSAAGYTLTEPPDPYAPVYPNNEVYKAASGHLIEIDSTPGQERISITHGVSKSFLEFHTNGDVVFTAKGKAYVLTEGNLETHVKGSLLAAVDGGIALKSTDSFDLSVEDIKALIRGVMKFRIVGELEIKTPLTKIGPQVLQGNSIHSGVYPFDLISGLPIPNDPTVRLG